MAHPNEEVVRQAFAAYECGDIETLRSQFLAPDIRWHFTRRSPLAGHYEGADGVVELYGRVAELSGGEPPQAVLRDVIRNDDHVVALHNLRMSSRRCPA